MKNKKIQLGSVIRRAIQLISFFLFPGLFISVFSSLKAIYISIISGNFNFHDFLPQIMTVAAVIPLTILLGRFFCGYLCAFGSMQDLFAFISKKLIRKKLAISEKADKVLKLFKYVLLLFIVVFIWTLGTVSFENSFNPWNIFGIYSSLSGWSDLSLLISTGFVLLVLIMIGSLFIERMFCRYLCPLGAIFVILSKLRLIRIKRTSNSCKSCRICTKSCPMGIPLYQYETINSGECIDCFECTGNCPKSNLNVSFARSEINPVAAGLITTAAMVGIYYVGNIISSNTISSLQDGVTIPLSSSDPYVQGQYTDGTYTGDAQGYRGTTKVQVTVENGFISMIEVISTDDDFEFFNLCKSPVVTDILESQSVDVSAVTGATYSSQAIMDAVADALDIPNGVITVQETAPAEDTATSNDAALPSAPGDEETAPYTDGVFTGTGTGYKGETHVSVTVSQGNITAIDVLSYEDDRPFFEQASPSVIEDIISSQSVEVDAVSGATFSCNGIMEAVANALNVDFTNPNSTLQEGGHGQHGRKWD